MAEGKNNYYICPSCFYHFATSSDYAEGSYCPQCIRANRSFSAARLASIKVKRVESQKCTVIVSHGKLCGGPRIRFRHLTICSACGNNMVLPGIFPDSGSQIGQVLEIYQDLGKIPKNVYELQRSGDVIIFQDHDIFHNNDPYYFVWLVT